MDGPRLACNLEQSQTLAKALERTRVLFEIPAPTDAEYLAVNNVIADAIVTKTIALP